MTDEKKREVERNNAEFHGSFAAPSSPAYPHKAAARADLNRSQRVIDKHFAQDQARRQGGPALTASQRVEWMDAFKRKQKAQQYLTSTQEPDLG